MDLAHHLLASCMKVLLACEQLRLPTLYILVPSFLAAAIVAEFLLHLCQLLHAILDFFQVTDQLYLLLITCLLLTHRQLLLLLRQLLRLFWLLLAGEGSDVRHWRGRGVAR